MARKNSPVMTEQDLIDRANKLRRLLGGQPLPNELAKEIIKQSKVAKKRVIKQKEVVPTEHAEQVKVIEWADSIPLIAGRVYSIPNGSHKSPFMANKFKAEGLRKGYPDLGLDMARRGFHGLRIELKRVKGSKTSDEQIEWIEYLTAQEYYAVVCTGAVDAIRLIGWYLDL